MHVDFARKSSVLRVLFAVLLAVVFSWGAVSYGQVSPTGTLIGTVTDPSGAAVPGATVVATGATTGASVTATSGSDGRFVMATMTPGVYNVTITKEGFKTGEFTEVKITVGLTYDLKAKLELGGTSTTVTVEAGVQELHTASASVSSTVVGPEITQLPFASRDTLNGLAILDPGAQTAGNPRNTSFDGLPKGSINITEDGINVQDNLLKSSDGFFSIIANKVDTIAEFNISTAANSASQTGEGAVQISMVSNKGGNQFHGGVWEYNRNTIYDSNYYFSNLSGQPRQVIKSNQFGFKIGGPILKDKLFFFGDMDNYRFPHSVLRTPTVPTTQTAQGMMTYNSTTAAGTPQPWVTCTGTTCTANLLQMAAANGFPSTADSVSGAIFSNMASAATAPGVTSQGNSSPYLDTISFLNSGVDKRYFPDVRLDYDLNQKNSIEFAYHYAHFTSNPDFLNGFDPTLPVAPFSTEVGGQISNRNLFVGAWRTTLGNNMSNEVRFGIQSAPVSFFPNLGLGIYPIASTNLGPEHIQPQFAAINSGIVTEPFHSFATQGRNTALGQLTDNFGWTKGSHFLSFGMSATQLRFNDFFDSGSVAPVSLGIDVNGNDPAANMFTTTNLPGISVNDINAAQQIYADVVGRVDGYSASVNLNPNVRQFVTGFPQLDKVSALEMGYYGSDSWQVRPGMTFTYGLRWEYQGIPHDKLNEYFNLQNGFAGVFGVSGLNNLFKPGTMTGSVPVISLNGSRNWYNKYYHSFGPTIGVAWQPGFQNSMYRRIFGGTGNTVFRAGYSVSFDRPGLNNFESLGPSNGGFVGFQFMNAGTTSAPGVFPGGSIALSSLSFPNVAQSPTSFTNSFPLDPLSGAGVNVYNPNLHAPYVQSWSAGIQRQLGANTVFEVRYVGNHAVGLWEQADLNETNIFENGFLTEFKNAQANLAINGGTSFADTGAGDVPVPILTAAFTGSTSGSQTDPLFSSGTFIRDLNLGLAGSFANSLAKDGSLTFICNMAGANFFPAGECPGSAPAVGAFPKNFFITNPDAVGGAFELYNGGQSTYNSLQLDVRRRMAAGLQFNGSYTFGKALTDQFVNSSISFFQFSTLRNPGLNKGPAPFDVRHSFKLESLYDLPFGPGHRMTTGNGVINRLIGGWSFNTVARWHSGRVQLLTGGLGGTFNGNDGGVNITGMSLSQIQSELGVIKTPCTTSGPSCTPTSKVGRVFYFPANLLGNGTNPLINGGGPANSAIFSACSTPGKFCGRPFIYGPEFFRADWSIDKMTKITERTTFELRLDALNVFNNADFFYGSSASGVAGSTSIQSNSFGRITNAYQDTGADDFGGRILQIVARINF